MRILTLISLLFVAAAASAQTPVRCPQDFLQLDAIARVTSAGSALGTDEAFAIIVAPDAVTRLIYASHRTSVAPGKKSDALLIDALPSDAITWDLLYTLTYPELRGVNDETVEIAGGRWLREAAAAVKRQKRGARAFLLQAYLGASNADISESFEGLYGEFRSSSPKQFWSAYKSLPLPARRSVPTAAN